MVAAPTVGQALEITRPVARINAPCRLPHFAPTHCQCHTPPSASSQWPCKHPRHALHTHSYSARSTRVSDYKNPGQSCPDERQCPSHSLVPSFASSPVSDAGSSLSAGAYVYPVLRPGEPPLSPSPFLRWGVSVLTSGHLIAQAS